MTSFYIHTLVIALYDFGTLPPPTVTVNVPPCPPCHCGGKKDMNIE